MRSCSFFSAAAGAAVILATPLFGCSSSTSNDPGEPADPDELFEPGPYDVGFRELTLTYDAAGDGGSRDPFSHRRIAPD